METEKEVLQEWYKRVAVTQAAHYYSAESLTSRKYWLGVPTVLLSTIVGTSVFATLKEQDTDPKIQIVLGLASVASAVLASLQTFLGDSERAEKHRVAGANYGALGRELEYILASDKNVNDIAVQKIKSKLDELAIESPNLSANKYKKAGSAKISILPKENTQPP